MFVGGCSDCIKSCIETDRGNYGKNHTGSHDIYNKSQFIHGVANHIETIAGKITQRKIILLKEYFKDLQSKMDQVRNRKIDEIISMKTQVAFSIGQEKNSRDLTKYAEMCINGKLADLRCNNAGFLMRGLYRMDKNLRNGEKIQYQIFNKVFKTARNQIENFLRSLQNSYIEQSQKLDEQMQKQLRTFILLKKLPNYIPERVEKAENFRDTKNIIVTRQKQQETSHPLLKKKITLVKQAPEKIQFAVRVKIEKICTTINGRRGEKIIFLARDSSGVEQLAFRKHEYIAQGNQIIIQRCKIQDIKGKNKIVSIYDSDIYLVPQIDTKPRQKREQRQGRNFNKRREIPYEMENYKRDGHNERQRIQKNDAQNNKRERGNGRTQDNVRENRHPRRQQQKVENSERIVNDRRDWKEDRREGRRDYKGEEKKQINNRRDNDQRKPRQKTKQNTITQRFRKQQQQQSYQKVQEITPDSQNITLQVKVHQIKVQIKQNLICMIGDETAIVQAQLPAKFDCVIQGGSIVIKGAYAEVRNQHIIMVIKPNSRLKRSLKSFPKINISKNISLESWVQDND